MQDPKKIADWLIKRAGGSPAARLYIAAISKAKGLLLTPGEQGTTAVSVVADMKAQGVAVREAEAAGPAGTAAPADAAAPAGAAAAAAPAGAAAAAATPGAPVVKPGDAAAAAAAASAVVAGLKKDAAAPLINVPPGGLGSGAAMDAAGENAKDAADAAAAAAAPAAEAPAGAAGEAAAEPAAAPAAEAPAGAAGEAAAEPAASAAPSGGRTRKTRHHTPKRKKLSRKKSVKRK
jgi:hypothetical protein